MANSEKNSFPGWCPRFAVGLDTHLHRETQFRNESLRRAAAVKKRNPRTSVNGLPIVEGFVAVSIRF